MVGATDQLNDPDVVDYPYQPQPAAILASAAKGSIGSVFPIRSRPFPWLAVCLGGYFAVSDVSVMPLTWVADQSDWGVLFIFVSFGAMLAQAALLSAGLVFGPGRYWKRLFCFWFGVTVFCILWTMGFVLHTAFRRWSGPSWDDVRFGILALPLAAIAIQAPLWFFRAYRGWRLVSLEENVREPPLAIRDYMLGTALVALSITFARVAVQPKDLKIEYWGVWGIFFGIAGILSLASVIPALWLILRFEWRLGLIGLMLYAATVASSFLAITEYFGVSPIAPFNIWEASEFMLIFISLAGFVGLGLKAARDMGLCLATRQATSRWHEELSAADERG
jgi:hypothetical protein